MIQKNCPMMVQWVLLLLQPVEKNTTVMENGKIWTTVMIVCLMTAMTVMTVTMKEMRRKEESSLNSRQKPSNSLRICRETQGKNSIHYFGRCTCHVRCRSNGAVEGK